jgi:hypothetical protein
MKELSYNPLSFVLLFLQVPSALSDQGILPSRGPLENNSSLPFELVAHGASLAGLGGNLFKRQFECVDSGWRKFRAAHFCRV